MAFQPEGVDPLDTSTEKDEKASSRSISPGHDAPHVPHDGSPNAPDFAPINSNPHIKDENPFDPDEKRELTEEDCYDELPFCWPKWKKWTVLSVVFLVQVSMNFNSSLYSNGISSIAEEFNVSLQAARVGAAVFLITYAFGCELWAPFSEECGRRWVLQISLALVNVWQILVALAPNFGSIIVGRALGGLSSAGGSVTLGMIADLWESDSQQYAVAFVVFSSVGGSALGPVVGGFVEQFLDWRWTIWIQLIFGGFVQLLHLFLVPETRTTLVLDKIAKKRRDTGKESNIYGPTELIPWKERFSLREILIYEIRPFRMFVTEPIVLTLSLLSGFSDALIFMFLQSYTLVYAQWDFKPWAVGVAFVPILVGYFIAWFSLFPVIKRNIRLRHAHPDDERIQYESRLWWLLYTAPCLPIGLFGFAWTSLGPPVHWIGTMVFSAIIGIANYQIYFCTIDYMITAYGPYSASATGGNGFSRDFLAGVLTVPATPFFTNIGRDSGYNLEYASTILACIAVLLIVAVYVVYWKGPTLRARSPFAQQLASARQENGGRRISMMENVYGSRRKSTATSIRRGSVLPSAGRHASLANAGIRPSVGDGGRGKSYASARAAQANRQIEEESKDV